MHCKPIVSSIVAACLSISTVAQASGNHHRNHAPAISQHQTQKGKISYYHASLAGRKMANGKPFRPRSNTAASKVLPLGTTAIVTNLKNGRSAVVQVEDRGPYVAGRVMDVSPATAKELDMKKSGVVVGEVTPIAIPPGAK